MKKLVLIFSLMMLLFSCQKPMSLEAYQNSIVDFHSFYSTYFKVYGTSTSTAAEMKQLHDEFLKREKKDLSTIEQMKESNYDEELPQIFEGWIVYIQKSNEQLTREIIVYKEKDYNDLEELTKFERFNRDNQNYLYSQESLLVENYFKFVNRHNLEPASAMLLLRHR